MSADLAVAVVGCGYWGSKHVRVLHGLDEVAGVVAVDPRPDRLAALARAFPNGTFVATLDEALPQVDAVLLATPPSTHAGLGLRVLRAGRHLFVEKPMATTAAAARQLVAAAAAADRILMVGHTFEHNGAVQELRRLMRSGELGDVYYLDTARLNLGLYQSDVNVVMDLAPHDISIANYLFGAQPASVETWASCHAHSTFEDVAYLRVHYENVGLAHIHVSWLDPQKVRRVTVVGSRKMAVYNDLNAQYPILLHDKGVTTPVHEDDSLTQAPMSYRYGDIVAPYVNHEEPLLAQDRHFIECALTGATPLTDGADGLAVVEVLEAAQLSIVERREVALAEIRSQDPGGHVLDGCYAGRAGSTHHEFR